MITVPTGNCKIATGMVASSEGNGSYVICDNGNFKILTGVAASSEIPAMDELPVDNSKGYFRYIKYLGEYQF